MIRWAKSALVGVLVAGVGLLVPPSDCSAENCLRLPVRPAAFGGPPVRFVAAQPAPAPVPPPPLSDPPQRPVPRANRPAAPTPSGPARVDRYGDRLPAGALARYGTVRLRHGPEPSAMAFSPDGKVLATAAATEDGLRLWDPATGREVARLPGPVEFATLARDGTVILLADGVCKMWDPRAGTVRPVPGDNVPPEAVALAAHPDGRSFAAAAKGRVVLLDLLTGKAVAELKVPGGQVPERVGYSPDGRWLAAAPGKGGVWLWDLKTGRRVRTYPVQAEGCDFAFSPDGTRLAVAADVLRVFPTDAEEPDEAFVPPDNQLHNPRFSADGTSLFAQQPDGTVLRLDAATGAVKETWNAPGDGMLNTPVALSPDAAVAAAVDPTGGIRVWVTKTGKGPEVDRLPPLAEPGVSADGKTVWCADLVNRIHAFEAATGKPVRVYDLPVDPELQLVWDARTGRAAVVVPGEPTEVHVLRADTGKVLARIPVGGDSQVAVAFCPSDPDRLLVCTPASAAVVSISTGRTVRGFSLGQTDAVVEGRFSPDGRLVALATHSLSVWEVGTGKRRFEFDAAPEPFGLAFSADGRLLAAWDDDGAITLFDVRAGVAVRRYLTPGATAVVTAAFTPDGRRLATGGADGLITLWDLAAGVAVLNLDGHDGEVTGLAFSADGKALVSTADDGTALVWDMTAEPAAEEAVAGLDEAVRLLGSADPAAAQRGMAFLYARPADAVKAMGEKVPVPAAVPADRLARLVADLGSEDFVTRQAAAKELEAVGGEAGPALRRVVASAPGAEARKLAADLLAKLDAPPTRPDDLRGMRAVEVLEGIGSPVARELLGKWAAGPPGHRLTAEAAAAVKRLSGP